MELWLRASIGSLISFILSFIYAQIIEGVYTFSFMMLFFAFLFILIGWFRIDRSAVKARRQHKEYRKKPKIFSEEYREKVAGSKVLFAVALLNFVIYFISTLFFA